MALCTVYTVPWHTLDEPLRAWILTYRRVTRVQSLEWNGQSVKGWTGAAGARRSGSGLSLEGVSSPTALPRRRERATTTTAAASES